MYKVTLVAAATALALGLTGCSEQPTQSSSNNQQAETVAKQETKKSQQLGSGIELENIDSNVRAQDDFYYHVNGKWLERTEIPGDKSNYGSFTALYDQSQAALKEVIEAAAKNSDAKAGSDEQKLGAFYTSYMNTDALEEKGITPLKPYLENIAAVSDKSELVSLMADIRIQGGTTPFAWYVNNDAKNSSQYALYVSQSGLGLPDRDYYLKDEEKFATIRDEYITYITDMLTKAGVEDAQQAAQDIVALESKLAKAQWSRVQSRDATKSYNKMTVAEASELTGEFDFAQFLAQSDIDSKEVIIRQPSYFEDFGSIFAETELDTWQDYLTFHFVSNYADELSKDFVDRKFAFYSTTLRGVEEQKPRWKKAVDSANAVLGEMLGKVYVKDNFPPEAKARMEELVENLIKGFDQAIDGLEWMSAETKVAAKEKLNKFTPKIGYPDKWKDYSALEIKADDLAGNFIRYSEWAYNEMREKLGKPVDRSEWHMTPQTVNAYYNPVNNEIVFPAAILQPPFFNLEADDAVNYGAIGAVIGHELGHGFDDQGAKYDGDGNLRNWWSEQDLAQFEQRGKKLVEQFNGFAPFEDASVNGELTLGENIGDLGGLTVAYKAYQLSLNGQPAPELDGFTGEQRFFMGWAQIWRRKYRDEELRNRLMTDPHAPSHYRVIGVLPNMPEFYEAFDVKEGDEMYIKPEDRVKIW
ncbi:MULTISPECIES: M13 family metallopeptidase [Pseudoalteromonas]|uniref:Peptidase M13 n=1 Tax=Pseudoalteromonas ruthenica TaxID=151081 RepID=A0A0F4PLG0_9GAMM|nr:MULTISPECIES: M13 family metallopeptidase [Pseudoalteromonas]KJY95056.1 peptidase M13 [Pseudoalteromonas ruthenica]KJY98737.1 peptidase M13 [Pseudoalteromonas ruthenica]MCG7566576.1 M13 family metallopeptidase [Pseudoalteromonas sp. CnMc7-15]TMO46420.1 M13 family peptidase [Pseudoalteromonas ruthenica]TMO50409.1 M13 family peptidase [Pseudoalteromonas ruthenica]